MISSIINDITLPIRTIPKIEVMNQELGKLSTRSYRDAYKPHYVVTELRNKTNKILGQEIFSLPEANRTSTGVIIKVEDEYQNKGWHFGEILRLSSIMAILENKIHEFEIYSKNTAVYFHSKYKFKPAIIQFQERNSTLESIVKYCGDEFREYGIKATELLQEVKNCTSNAKQRELCVKTNILTAEYIQKVLQTKDEYKKHPFDKGMSMVLTDDEIKNNKDFFNGLFKKHNINYTI